MGGVEDEHLKLSQTKSILCQVYDTCEGPLDCGRPRCSKAACRIIGGQCRRWCVVMNEGTGQGIATDVASRAVKKEEAEVDERPAGRQKGSGANQQLESRGGKKVDVRRARGSEPPHL